MVVLEFPQARELDKELRALLKEKDGAVRGQDFEKAGQLRDREMELKAQIAAVTAGNKEGEDAEKESGEGGGPMVTEQDIANIVCQWTGIPIDKVCAKASVLFSCCAILLYVAHLIGQEGIHTSDNVSDVCQP